MLSLSTPRLLMRELAIEDAPALFEVPGDAETMRFYPRPFTLEETKGRIQGYMATYRSGTGLIAMVLSKTGTLIGDCGITWQEVEGVTEPEIGYHLHRAWWNKGLATEAARAARDDAFTGLSCDRVISLIRPENLPSRRVAEKNGLTLDRIIVWGGYEHCVYQLRKAAR